MLKLVECLTEDTHPPRFSRVQRVEHDLACPHCGDKMGEKDFSFGFDATSGMWYHTCGDGGSRRMIRSTEEQEKQSAQAAAYWSKGGFR